MFEGSYTWSHLLRQLRGHGAVGQRSGRRRSHHHVRLPGSDGALLRLLPQDRRHNLKLFGAYSWDFGLQIGANAGWRTGRPINSFGVHPTDDWAVLRRRIVLPHLGRTDCPGSLRHHRRRHLGLDLMLKYDFRLGLDWFVRLDVFNLFNHHAVTEVNEYASRARAPLRTTWPTRTTGTHALPNPARGAVRSRRELLAARPPG